MAPDADVQGPERLAEREPKIRLRRFSAKRIARELKAALPALKVALAQIEESKRVSRACLDFEITI